MTFRCSLTIDCVGSGGNEYEKLKCALIARGREWIETSSFFIDTDVEADALKALELVGNAAQALGGFSHISYQFQRVGSSKVPSSLGNHPSAEDDIICRPFP